VIREPRILEDWTELRRSGLTTVVDPMVFRTADMFFGGATGLDDVDTRRWSAIDKNVGALTAFVDSVVLDDGLPMFDYSMTFREFGLLVATSPFGDLLVPVAVADAAREGPRARAHARLAERAPIGAGLVQEINDELEALEYKWGAPGLPPEDVEHPADAADAIERVRIFTYGGMLFDEYALELGGEHVLAPKRGRLFTSASLGRRIPMGALFDELRREVDRAPKGVERLFPMPELPAFLPYILEFLDDTATPHDVLGVAFQIRDDDDVCAYRQWRTEANHELDPGRPVEIAAEAERLAQAVRNSLKPHAAEAHTVQMVQQFLGERPYRRLLLDLALAQHQYTDLTKRLHEIWRRGDVDRRG
jgi:hypothetical protein